MKTYTPEELKSVLEQHKLWFLTRFDAAPQGQRAYLQGANLQGANLQGAYLQGAYLQGAYLQGAYLQGANLQGANLQGANLQGAYLQRADLQGANLQGAYLQGAYLQGADLQGAYLQGADLQGAYLPDFSLVPSEGVFVAWKKVKGGAILKLEVLVDAKRTSPLVGRKCRASAVRVLSALGASEGQTEFFSTHDSTFVYRVGEVASVADFDDDVRVECTRGIHFFITEKEAREY